MVPNILLVIPVQVQPPTATLVLRVSRTIIGLEAFGAHLKLLKVALHRQWIGGDDGIEVKPLAPDIDDGARGDKQKPA
jgi:hypothetical protein